MPQRGPETEFLELWERANHIVHRVLTQHRQEHRAERESTMGSHVALFDPVQELLDERPVAELEGLKAWTVEKKGVGSLVGHSSVPDHHCVQGLAQPCVRLRIQTQEMPDSKVGHTH